MYNPFPSLSNSKTASSNTKRKCGAVSFIFKKVVVEPDRNKRCNTPHSYRYGQQAYPIGYTLPLP